MYIRTYVCMYVCVCVCVRVCIYIYIYTHIYICILYKDLSSKGVAVFPAILSIIPGNVFNKKNPIILGADVIEGSLRIGTPLCIPELNFLEIGKVTSIQNNHKEVKVCV
jgi:hypothetical protein